MKTQKFLSLAAITFLMAINGWATPDPTPEEGKAIFLSRCAACHNVNKVLTGPALAGVDERRSIDWIISFVKSSQTMVKKGDKDAVALYEKFNKVPMPDHADLTDDNIRSIVAFIQSEGQAAKAAKTSLTRPAQKKQNSFPVSLTKDYSLFIALLASVALLIGTLLFAARVQRLKKNPELLAKFRAL